MIKDEKVVMLGGILAAHPHLYDRCPGGLLSWLLPTAPWRQSCLPSAARLSRGLSWLSMVLALISCSGLVSWQSTHTLKTSCGSRSRKRTWGPQHAEAL